MKMPKIIRNCPTWVRFMIVVAIFIGLYQLSTRLMRYYASKNARRLHDDQIRKTIETETNFVDQMKTMPRQQEMSVSDAKRMVRTLHEGVPDKYTSDGRYISGIAPDPIEAAKVYEFLLQKGETDIIRSYANLCEFGPDEVRDLRKARALYNMHYHNLSDLGDRYDILEAIERVSNPSEQWYISRVRSDIAADLSTKAAVKTKQIIKENPARVRTVDEDIWILPEDAFRAPDIVNTNINAAPNDRHNAHDSGVTKTVKASIDKLRDRVGEPEIPSHLGVKQVRDAIANGDISDDRRRNAIQALDAIERNNHFLTASDTTEVDLLNLVWNRIHHDDNKDNRDSLRDNLLNELSECVEHNKTVCTSGRFNRIISSLNGVDDLVDIKPKWAINRELVDKAGVLYQDKINALDEDSRTAVNAIDATPEQEAAAETILRTVKQDIRNDFKKSYVDTGILTEDALNVEVDKWIDAI